MISGTNNPVPDKWRQTITISSKMKESSSTFVRLQSLYFDWQIPKAKVSANLIAQNKKNDQSGKQLCCCQTTICVIQVYLNKVDEL